MKKLLQKLKLVNHNGFLISIRRPFGIFFSFTETLILISLRRKKKRVEFPFFNANPILCLYGLLLLFTK